MFVQCRLSTQGSSKFRYTLDCKVINRPLIRKILLVISLSNFVTNKTIKRNSKWYLHMTYLHITSKLPIDLCVSQLFLYHFSALLKFLSLWYDSPMTRNESPNFSLSHSSLATLFFLLANSRC